MILHRFFDFLRIFNANAPSLVEARWALKYRSRQDSIQKTLKLRSRGKSLKTIGSAENLSEELVRNLLIQGAEEARTKSRNRSKAF